MQVGVDAFSASLHHYLDSAADLATALQQTEQVKRDGFSQGVRDRVQPFLVHCQLRFGKAAQHLAEQADLAIKVADPRNR